MITVAFYNPISDKYSERNFMNLYYFNSKNETEFGRGIGLSYGEHIENLIGSNLEPINKK